MMAIEIKAMVPRIQAKSMANISAGVSCGVMGLVFFVFFFVFFFPRKCDCLQW